MTEVVNKTLIAAKTATETAAIWIDTGTWITSAPPSVPTVINCLRRCILDRLGCRYYPTFKTFCCFVVGQSLEYPRSPPPFLPRYFYCTGTSNQTENLQPQTAIATTPHIQKRDGSNQQRDVAKKWRNRAFFVVNVYCWPFHLL